MEELLNKIRKEKIELLGKIKRLENFRGTDEWNKISINHKQLLDIQLNAMRTYIEALIARELDIKENIEKEVEPNKNDEDEPVKVIIIGLGE